MSLEQKDGEGSGHSKCPPLGVSGSWECPRANLSSLVSQKHEHPEGLAQLLPAGQALLPAPQSPQEASVLLTAREAESRDVT